MRLLAQFNHHSGNDEAFVSFMSRHPGARFSTFSVDRITRLYVGTFEELQKRYREALADRNVLMYEIL